MNLGDPSLVDPFVHDLHPDDLPASLAVLLCRLLSLCLELSDDVLQVLLFYPLLQSVCVCMCVCVCCGCVCVVGVVKGWSKKGGVIEIQCVQAHPVLVILHSRG